MGSRTRRREQWAARRQAGQEQLCHLCGSPVFPDDDDFTLDHLVPRSQGGPTKAYNLAVAHRECNLRRGDRPVACCRFTRRAQLWNAHAHAWETVAFWPGCRDSYKGAESPPEPSRIKSAPGKSSRPAGIVWSKGRQIRLGRRA